MELLGHNLQHFHNKCNNKFSLRTTLLLFDQILERISFIHENGYLHRNIKPENFLMGRNENKSTVYLIDFMLAKKFVSDGNIKPFRKGRQIKSSLRYSSINSQLGFEQSPRDELESIGYMMIYFLKGELPWQNITASTKDEKFSLVLKSKLSTKIQTLTKGLPEEFKDYMNYVKSLDYETMPDYTQLRNLFKQRLLK